MNWTIPVSNHVRGAVFVVSGAIGLAIGITNVYQDHLLATHGVRTEGIVLGKDDTCSYRTCDKNLRFRFQSQDGTDVTTSEAVHHSIWSKLNAGDQVPITYHAENPTNYRFEFHSDYRKSETKRYGFGFGALFVLIGLGFLIFGRSEVPR